MAVPQRFYESTLLGVDGSEAGVISVPSDADSGGWIPAIERAWEIGLPALGDRDPRIWLLTTRRIAPSDSIVHEWLSAPIVIIEESPPVGRALESVIAATTGAGGGAVLIEAGASEVVLAAYGTAWALAWLVSPMVGGAREGVREAFRDDFRERTADWLRKHR